MADAAVTADMTARWKALADELAAAIRREFDGFPDEEMFLTTTEALERYDRLREGSLLAATAPTNVTVCWRCGGTGTLQIDGPGGAE